jgi:hypothetical protein
MWTKLRHSVLCYAQYHVFSGYAECHIFRVMLCVVMFSIVILSVVMLSVIMPTLVMLNAITPCN